MSKEHQRHLCEQMIKIGGLLAECKKLVEFGREAEANKIVPTINTLYENLDKDCRKAGYKGGIKELEAMFEQNINQN